jgi:hypothetical protein
MYFLMLTSTAGSPSKTPQRHASSPTLHRSNRALKDEHESERSLSQPPEPAAQRYGITATQPRVLRGDLPATKQPCSGSPQCTRRIRRDATGSETDTGRTHAGKIITIRHHKQPASPSRSTPTDASNHHRPRAHHPASAAFPLEHASPIGGTPRKPAWSGRTRSN